MLPIPPRERGDDATYTTMQFRFVSVVYGSTRDGLWIGLSGLLHYVVVNHGIMYLDFTPAITRRARPAARPAGGRARRARARADVRARRGDNVAVAADGIVADGAVRIALFN